MPGSEVPVIRQPYGAGDTVPFWGAGAIRYPDQLFDRREDTAEHQNLAAEAVVSEALDGLREALREIEAPAEQLERLGF
jgi:hypothetical protein